MWIQDQNGCKDSIIKSVEISPIYNITIPNIFTPDPNNSGGGYYDPLDLSNDVFYPFVKYVEDFRMRIYNRWGELVHNSIGPWDGTFEGEEQPTGTYIFHALIQLANGDEKNISNACSLLR